MTFDNKMVQMLQVELRSGFGSVVHEIGQD